MSSGIVESNAFADLELPSTSKDAEKDLSCGVVPTRDDLDPPTTSANAKRMEKDCERKNTATEKKEAVNERENPVYTKSNEEIIRMIAEYLQELGLEKTVQSLLSETGCNLEHPTATKFREHVLSGQWNKALEDLKELQPLIENGNISKILDMKFIILEEKYLELLDDGCILEAVNVLRNEFKPQQHDYDRINKISKYIMCIDNHDFHETAKYPGKGSVSRALVMQTLQTFLSPSLIMSPRRLLTLLQQAVELQIQNCPFHDIAWETNLQNVSLLANHSCAKDEFPLKTIQIISDHRDEVWLCKFSPDGLKLATGCKDGTVYIWDVDPDTLQIKKRRILDVETEAKVVFMDWSFDSKMLLLGGQEHTSVIYVFNVDDGRVLVNMSDVDLDASLCGTFNRDCTKFVCASQKGVVFLFDLNGDILDSWKGVRVNGVAYRSDNKTLLAADNQYCIRAYNFEHPTTDNVLLREKDPITTFSVNSTGQLALLNISKQALHLWDLDRNCLVRSFHGTQQSKFAIISCFGGVNENFVASGSEDNNIFIWNLKHEEPIAKLSGHTGTVNCVSWNPVFPSLLASASDDNTVRIWGPTVFNHKNTARNSDESHVRHITHSSFRNSLQ